ncbi:flagellar hook capping FlgD N-terminal domain-containing protein [Sulfurimonas sp.]|uniref:flagellar hook capping FlgD N-terminal domain-containing protein n=1 Tax=Sulfurimonas sp. TaxID=2022749 RepID=UPI0025FBB306|nr:flagellar hook capping FlgD N-terminal domain-containing protein [Sulfurimonas sp.]MDD5157771.1 flagellar hook capping FlgD N-terminal domain-containing protein [Sulfurimonas sp.]
MSITSTGLNAATNTDYTASTAVKDKTSLGKDDFLKLLLVELQYQDPTAPMDTDKILSQTSQLAALESSTNTNTALENLTASLGSSQQFSTISAIGKTADIGSNAITYDEGTNSEFEVYFPNSVQEGTVNITDLQDNKIATINVGTNPSGVYKFEWDGKDSSGGKSKSGIYKVTANYTDQSGTTQTTRLGAYPIESVKFDSGTTYLKLGSSYVPLAQVKEVY